MNVSSLNQQLQAVYRPYLDTVYNQTWLTGVSAPLLMNVFEEYVHVPRKILFIGQETHGWAGDISNHYSVEDLQNTYTDFKLGKCADYGDGLPLRFLRSPFWNFSRSFFHRINGHDKAVSRKTNGFLWTNISKFDVNTTTPSMNLQQQNKAGFELLKDELAILQPDVVVFLTGSKYDFWLDELFSLNRTPIIEHNFLNVLEDHRQLLPPLTFQTQHPRTLNMQKMYHSVLSKMTELATH